MKTRIFAHRGASGNAPENTLEAFDLAVRMGADGVELDVQVCRSGELVVAHDETVDRVSDGSGRICDHSLKELKSLAFCRTHPEYKNTRLPLLSEVFQLLQPCLRLLSWRVSQPFHAVPWQNELSSGAPLPSASSTADG